MSAMEAHLKANQNLTGSANDGGLGYMVYTVPEGQEFIGINGKVNPQATLGRRLVYEGQEYYVRPDAGPTPHSARRCVRSTTSA